MVWSGESAGVGHGLRARGCRAAAEVLLRASRHPQHHPCLQVRLTCCSSIHKKVSISQQQLLAGQMSNRYQVCRYDLLKVVVLSCGLLSGYYLLLMADCVMRRSHPRYVLERHIGRYQALKPGTTKLGLHRGEAFYPRDALQDLHTVSCSVLF